MNEAKIDQDGKNPPAAGDPLPRDDVASVDARARDTTAHDCEIPTKKRKTRRGKSKRRYPYQKNERKSSASSTKVIKKPEAPYNSNQFLLEDHGCIEELDENLKNTDRMSSRTRDSSFSGDSEGEFYSSPDDEKQFLIKDFVDQYETVQAERLQSLTKDELIQEYLLLESKLELLRQRRTPRNCDESNDGVAPPPPPADLQKEVDRLMGENEALRRENAVLRSKTCSSEDSETDSDDSCSSTSSSSSSCSSRKTAASPLVDYSQTNGHSASVETV